MRTIEFENTENVTEIMTNFEEAIKRANESPRKGIKAQKVRTLSPSSVLIGNSILVTVLTSTVEYDLLGAAAQFLENDDLHYRVRVEKAETPYSSASYRVCFEPASLRADARPYSEHSIVSRVSKQRSNVLRSGQKRDFQKMATHGLQVGSAGADGSSRIFLSTDNIRRRPGDVLLVRRLSRLLGEDRRTVERTRETFAGLPSRKRRIHT